MPRKMILMLAAAAVVIVLAAGYLYRPKSIQVGNEVYPVYGPVITARQALHAAGVAIDPRDQVEPALDRIIPLSGQVRVQRIVQALLWEDGQARRISGFEPTAGKLLASAGITLGPADLLLQNGKAITPTVPLDASGAIVLQIRRARAVIIDRGGQRQKIDTTAQTALEALWEAGVRVGPGDLVSVPLESSLNDLAKEAGGGPVMIGYQAAQPLTIQIGQQIIQARTTAATIGQALAGAGAALQGLDYSIPAEDQPVPADGKVRVVRVREEISLKEELLPFGKKTTMDSNVPLDQTRVTQSGQMGVKVTRERVRFEDGKEVSRGVDSDWIASEPAPETIGIGTKITPATADTPGGKIEYWRAVRVYATSYAPCEQGYDHCSWSTASGMRLNKGVVATSLRWYRMMLGQRVYITGYGFGVIGDYGGMSGMWIDLGFDEDQYKSQAFTGWVTMYFLTPVPANIMWTLP